MGVSRSKKVVDTSNVEFSVPIRNLRISGFNNYSSFDPGFQVRFSLNVWSEFRQSVEAAVHSYTHDPQLTHWKGTYKCLTMLAMVLVIISAISVIYSFYALLLGLVFEKFSIWVSGVILMCLICVWALIGFAIRCKLSTIKEAYHRDIHQRVGNAMQQLNAKYKYICHFQMYSITGKFVDFFDFSIRLSMFFRITLFEQQVNPQVNPQYGAIGQFIMPNGQMIMAQMAQQYEMQYIAPNMPEANDDDGEGAEGGGGGGIRGNVNVVDTIPYGI